MLQGWLKAGQPVAHWLLVGVPRVPMHIWGGNKRAAWSRCNLQCVRALILLAAHPFSLIVIRSTPCPYGLNDQNPNPTILLIVQAKKGKQVLAFYTMPEYENWRESLPSLAGWDIKYYKVGPIQRCSRCAAMCCRLDGASCMAHEATPGFYVSMCVHLYGVCLCACTSTPQVGWGVLVGCVQLCLGANVRAHEGVQVERSC